MTKYYIRWHLNPMTVPVNPEERVKLWTTMLEMVRADLKSGAFKDWGICNDISAGFCFSELDEQMLHTAITRYVPYVMFDIKPFLNVEQSIDSIKRAVAATKK